MSKHVCLTRLLERVEGSFCRRLEARVGSTVEKSLSPAAVAAVAVSLLLLASLLLTLASLHQAEGRRGRRRFRCFYFLSRRPNRGSGRPRCCREQHRGLGSIRKPLQKIYDASVLAIAFEGQMTAAAAAAVAALPR